MGTASGRIEPAQAIKKYREQKRERFLSPAELRRVGEVLREMEQEGIELPFSIAATTAGMRRRLDASVPDGTDIVILQPGANDLRFFGSNEQRGVNIQAMVKRPTERKISVIVYDPVFPQTAYQWDRIHLSADAHRKIAIELFPQIKSIVDARAAQRR